MNSAIPAAPVAVIGAGWAGLTAALVLARAGKPVHLIEAGSVPGGRARSLTLGGATLDNGQHVLIGACNNSLDLIRSVGVDPGRAFHALPFGLRMFAPATPYPVPTFSLEPRSPRLPALALALYRAQPATRAGSRLRAIRGAARMLHRTLATDRPVLEWLHVHRQPPGLIQRLWEPLCLAIMNTPARAASACLFQNVLRRALNHGPEAARLLLPARPLGALFPEPALGELHDRNAHIELGRRITRIERDPGDRARPYCLHDRAGGTSRAGGIIVATSPAAAQALLPVAPEWEASSRGLQALGARSICTVYLRYARRLDALPPLSGLLDQHGQWLIPRHLSGAPHWLAVVISAADDLEPMTAATRWRHVASTLARTFPLPVDPVAGHTICEHRATLDAHPDIDARRPSARTPWPRIYLAGDYLTRGLPSTLEAAVQSGLESAHKYLEDQP